MEQLTEPAAQMTPSMFRVRKSSREGWKIGLPILELPPVDLFQVSAIDQAEVGSRPWESTISSKSLKAKFGKSTAEDGHTSNLCRMQCKTEICWTMLNFLCQKTSLRAPCAGVLQQCRKYLMSYHPPTRCMMFCSKAWRDFQKISRLVQRTPVLLATVGPLHLLPPRSQLHGCFVRSLPRYPSACGMPKSVPPPRPAPAPPCLAPLSGRAGPAQQDAATMSRCRGCRAEAPMGHRRLQSWSWRHRGSWPCHPPSPPGNGRRRICTWLSHSKLMPWCNHQFSRALRLRTVQNGRKGQGRPRRRNCPHKCCRPCTSSREAWALLVRSQVQKRDSNFM